MNSVAVGQKEKGWENHGIHGIHGKKAVGTWWERLSPKYVCHPFRMGKYDVGAFPVVALNSARPPATLCEPYRVQNRCDHRLLSGNLGGARKVGKTTEYTEYTEKRQCGT
jgi:hypothetical protein